VGRFLGPGRAVELFTAYARLRGVKGVDELEGDRDLVRFAELQLAGTIGAASARTMVATVAQEEPLGLEEVMTIIDEASQVIAYSHRLEEKQGELEAATQELRAANERLKELDRLKDDFISTVTQRSCARPLTLDPPFSEILHDNPDLGAAERQRFLGLVIKESERLNAPHQPGAGTWRRSSRGLAEWRTAVLDMREIVLEAVNATSAHLQVARGAHRHPHRADGAFRHGRPHDRLMQVLLNLLSNAAKFCTPGTGRVEAASASDGAVIRVDVEDNGVGISPRTQALIFENSGRWATRSPEKPSGTGLGLAICLRNVGPLSAAGCGWKARPGRGSVFRSTCRSPPATRGGLARTPEGGHGQARSDRGGRAQHRDLARVPQCGSAASRRRSAADGEEALSLLASQFRRTWCSSTSCCRASEAASSSAG